MLLIFLGIMMGQFLYMCTLWWQHRRKEYAYYVVHYIIFIYFLFGLSYDHVFPLNYVQQHEQWFSLLKFQPLHIFNYYLYIKFAQHFLETEKLYPAKNAKAVKMMKGVWICTAVSVLCWFIFGPDHKVFASIYLVISIFLMIWAIWLVYLIYTMRTKQSAYIFRGSLLLSIGILLTYVMLSLEQAGVIPRNLIIFYPSILGVLGEIYFVNAGLNYKASIKRKELIHTQQQLIYELERNKILHHKKDNVRNDLSLQLNREIGLTLDGINLFAEHSVQKFQKGEIPQVETILHRIVDDSNRMVSSMNDIVWMLNSENDTIDKTITRLQLYTTRLCRDKKAKLVFTFQSENSLMELDMQQRKQLYDLYKITLAGLVTGNVDQVSVNILIRKADLHFDFELTPKELAGTIMRSSFTFQTHPSG